MYAPVDVLLSPRGPRTATCDLRLFDPRNYLITQLMTIAYLPLEGGDFRAPDHHSRAGGRTGASLHRPLRLHRGRGGLPELQPAGAPARGTSLTGTITTNGKSRF